MKMIEHLNWRYATKIFDPNKKIDDHNWELLEESLRLTPSSYGLQPWKFLVITNEEIKKQLVPLSMGQTQVGNCSHLVVLTARNRLDSDYIKNYFLKVESERNLPVGALKAYCDRGIKHFVENDVNGQTALWAQKQSYIAMGIFLSTAAMLQIDSCPLEGIDKVRYDEFLGIGPDYSTCSVIAAGYRAKEDQLQHEKKIRFSKDEIIRRIN